MLESTASVLLEYANKSSNALTPSLPCNSFPSKCFNKLSYAILIVVLSNILLEFIVGAAILVIGLSTSGIMTGL